MSRFTAFCPKSDTVHLTAQEIDVTRGYIPATLALCGRNLKPTGVYSEKAVPRFADAHKRLSLTHETGLCRNCFDRHAGMEK